MNSCSQQAVDWFLRLRSVQCTEADRAAFSTWLSSDPHHRTEFAEVTSMWTGMDKVLAAPFPELEAALALPPESTPSPASSLQADARSLSWFFADRWIPAALVLCLAIGGWWWYGMRTETYSYATNVGEQKTVTLADGSRLDLNTATQVTATFSARRRAVDLRQGEVAVTVAHQADRPFSMTAGGGTILDIGTQFIVRQQPDRTDVAVLQGAVLVEVSPDLETESRAPVRVNAGQRYHYRRDGLDNGPVLSLDNADAQRVAAWREGKLVLTGVSLAEAVREVNRYWPGQIVFDAPNLAAVTMQGVFNISQLDQFFTTLPRILPVEIVRRTPDQLLIIARPTKQP